MTIELTPYTQGGQTVVVMDSGSAVVVGTFTRVFTDYRPPTGGLLFGTEF